MLQNIFIYVFVYFLFSDVSYSFWCARTCRAYDKVHDNTYSILCGVWLVTPKTVWHIHELRAFSYRPLTAYRYDGYIRFNIVIYIIIDIIYIGYLTSLFSFKLYLNTLNIWQNKKTSSTWSHLTFMKISYALQAYCKS